MCGICGIIHARGQLGPVSSTLDRMTDVMTHRGPNDRGTTQTPLRSAFAGSASSTSRAVISRSRTRTAASGRSRTASSTTTLQISTRARGRGHRFAARATPRSSRISTSSTATTFPEQLRGKFGIAVWDETRRRAVLARDRLGVKPLYYAQVGDLLVFGSELKSVLASGLVDPELDYEAIDAYLTLGFFPGPRTPLRGVTKLMPGHRLVVEDGVRVRGVLGATRSLGTADGRSDEEYQRAAAATSSRNRCGCG